ncbi:MAG: tRNA lysidine(34) synthetase TilS [Planctomycetota bacterium]|nr:tRNA lysidine(34) synthetase TilS [Planctomycetota bacterium]
MTERPSQPVEATNAIPLEARRHPLVHEIERGFRWACGGEAPGPVVLAVSGGRDSMALLIASAVLREHDTFAILPRVVHVHHHLRPEADDEAEHVLAVAAVLDVPAEVRHLKSPAHTPGDARRLRYEALQQAAMACRSNLVATGHHAEDQLETILAALGRGAGPSGLAGMPRRRTLEDDVSLVRPMLSVSRMDAEALCRAAGTRWCDDPGNVDINTQRGRLRRDVLPVLEAMWPGVASRAAAGADLQSVAATALEGLVTSVFGTSDRQTWSRLELSGLPIAVIASGLRRAVLACGPLGSDGVSHSALFAAAEAVGDRRDHRRRYELGGGIEIIVEAIEIRIEQTQGDA